MKSFLRKIEALEVRKAQAQQSDLPTIIKNRAIANHDAEIKRLKKLNLFADLMDVAIKSFGYLMAILFVSSFYWGWTDTVYEWAFWSLYGLYMGYTLSRGIDE